jgi:4-amino-4-deoxy-L-arabinose transferase-like glycosyltransferase
MDEQRSPAPTQPATAAPFGRADLGLILLLIFIAVGLRWWQFTHTEVAARDSIGYIRIAWRMEQEIHKQRAHRRDPEKPDGDWAGVVRSAPQHPGYPVAILAVSRIVRRFHDGDLPLVMQWSAQLTSAAAAVLLGVPMFLLGRGLFNRRAGFVAALLFQCLPTSGRLMADGLSEPLFLLFVCMALLFAHYGLRNGSPWWFAGVGLCGGLAYLTRPEGALVVAVVGVVLVALQAFAAWRRTGASFAQSGILLTWGALTVAGPFVLIVGHLTTKHTPQKVIEAATAQASTKALGAEDQDQPPVVGDAVPGGMNPSVPAPLGTGPALRLYVGTLLKSFFYVTWVPALLGFVLWRDRFRLAPISWVLALVTLALQYFLYRVPVVMGYLSDRHMVLILLCVTFWTAAGLVSLGDWLAELCGGLYAAWGRGGSLWGQRLFWASVLLLPLLGVALPKTLEPMHMDRLPYRDAGVWLAQHTQPDADIDDPYCWAAYYAGRMFRETPAHDQARLCYVVIEKGDHQQRWKPQTDPSKWRDKEPVMTWPVRRGKEQLELVVYEVTQ